MDLQLRVNRLRCFSFHGVLPQEQQVGTHYIISLKLHADVQAALWSDDLADTVSYADIVMVVQTEMKIVSQLIEHAAGRIVDALFRQFDPIYRIELSLSKENPPGCGDLDSTEIFVDVERLDWGFSE